MKWRSLNLLTADQLQQNLGRDDVVYDAGVFRNVDRWFVPGNPIIRNRFHVKSELYAHELEPFGVDLMSEVGDKTYTAGLIILKSQTRKFLDERAERLRQTAVLLPDVTFSAGEHPSWQSFEGVRFDLMRPSVLLYLIGNCFRQRPEVYEDDVP